jgi:CBS domain-containing protein
MQVREIMSSPAITVTLDTPIREVARQMREQQISGVLVVDERGALAGIITAIDLIARHAPLHEPRYIAVLSAMIPVSIEEYREYKEQLRQVLAVTARDLMRTGVETIAPTATTDEALALMLNPETTLLPVVEGDRVVGALTRTDLVWMIEDLEMMPSEGESTGAAAKG